MTFLLRLLNKEDGTTAIEYGLIAAGIAVAIIVAVNKMDKPGADPEKIKKALTEFEMVPEEWGGDTIYVPVSAKTGKGIPELGRAFPSNHTG